MKKQSPKLRLSKETLRSLNLDAVKEAAGGTSLSYQCSPYPSYDPCAGSDTNGNRRCY